VAGGAKRSPSTAQARALLNTVRPRDLVGRTRRQLASELITELVGIDKKIKAVDAQLTELLAQTGSTVQQLHGIGPSSAARLVGDIADITRFATPARFASWNGTAPLDVSSGDQQRHRLSRAGNRQINRVLHVMAITQLRGDTQARAYYRTPTHRQPSMAGYRSAELPGTDEIARTNLALPMGSGLQPAQIEEVVAAVGRAARA